MYKIQICGIFKHFADVLLNYFVKETLIKVVYYYIGIFWFSSMLVQNGKIYKQVEHDVDPLHERTDRQTRLIT